MGVYLRPLYLGFRIQTSEQIVNRRTYAYRSYTNWLIHPFDQNESVMKYHYFTKARHNIG